MPGVGPLAGYRVVDFTANMSGPWATMVLGDQGADVVKVEPPAGDPIRTLGTSHRGMSAYFANLNRSKRSVVLDLGRPESRAVLERLLDSADVVVQNFRPAVAVRLGLDPASVREGRPGVVYAAIEGFGPTGPYAGRPAYDHVVQALSGFAARQADPKDGIPRLVRHGVIDKWTGQVTAQAITAALLQRARTGEGCEIAVSMLDASIAYLWPDGMINHTIVEPDTLLPPVANSFRLTATQDGHVAIAVLTGQQFASLLAAFAIPEDERLRTPEGRMRHGGELMRQVVAKVGEMKTDDVIETMTRHDVPCTPVVDLDDLADHPQVVANASIDAFDHPVVGPVRQANPVVRWRGERAGELPAAPTLGHHTAEVLGELGYGADEVQALLDAGVAGAPAA